MSHIHPLIHLAIVTKKLYTIRVESIMAFSGSFVRNLNKKENPT